MMEPFGIMVKDANYLNTFWTPAAKKLDPPIESRTTNFKETQNSRCFLFCLINYLHEILNSKLHGMKIRNILCNGFDGFINPLKRSKSKCTFNHLRFHLAATFSALFTHELPYIQFTNFRGRSKMMRWLLFNTLSIAIKKLGY